MWNKIKKRDSFAPAVVMIGAVLFVLGAVGVARANRFTRGDAQAMLNNYPPGKNIFSRLMPEPGPVLDIRPFGDFYAFNTYCEDDWHVLALTWDAPVFNPRDEACYPCQQNDFFIDPLPFDKPPAAASWLRQLDAEFTLDGVTIPEEELHRGPVKPWIDSGALFFNEETGDFEGGYGKAFYEYVAEQCGCDVRVKVYAIQFGKVVSPSELPAGAHTIEVTITHSQDPPRKY